MPAPLTIDFFSAFTELISLGITSAAAALNPAGDNIPSQITNPTQCEVKYAPRNSDEYSRIGRGAYLDASRDACTAAQDPHQTQE